MSGMLLAWRHPRPLGVAGRCIGRTDVALDPRKARRLAAHVHRRATQRTVITSPLARCADVGRALARMGWRHTIDPALVEMDFGEWDGRPWSAVERAEIDAWTSDFAGYAPGGGESLASMFARVAAWQAPPDALVIAHGGWMLVRRWIAERGRTPPSDPDQWPCSPAYCECWSLPGWIA